MRPSAAGSARRGRRSDSSPPCAAHAALLSRFGFSATTRTGDASARGGMREEGTGGLSGSLPAAGSRCGQYSGRVANESVAVARGYHERTPAGAAWSFRARNQIP